MKKLLQKKIIKLANIINNRLNQNWKELTRNEFRFFDIYFSQYGEDIFINNKLRNICNGTYCDVGAFDPIWFSNTHLLFKRGWTGLNLDLDQDKIKKFKEMRPKDISIVSGVGNCNEKAWALEYSLPVLNRISFYPEHDFLAANGEKPLGKHEIQIRTLDTVLEQHIKGRNLNFLNIDCEGYEEKILNGITLKKWKPNLIAIEYLDDEKLMILKRQMLKNDYQLCGQVGITAFFEPN